MNVGYGDEGGGGSYHSVYDSFDHYTRFVDPGFPYGIAQAETTGRLVLRLANADVLPLEFTTFADTLSRYVEELTKLAQTTRTEIEERNRLIRERAYEIAADPTKTYVSPKPETPAPYLNFAPLQNAVARLQQSAREYDRAATSIPSDAPNAASRETALDHALMHIEQALTTSQGLPRRPWFRHEIYAPGVYTGYAAQPLTDFAQAIDDRKATNAKEGLQRIVESIKRATEVLKKATE